MRASAEYELRVSRHIIYWRRVAKRLDQLCRVIFPLALALGLIVLYEKKEGHGHGFM